MTQGNLTTTEKEYDVAIRGEGFFQRPHAGRPHRLYAATARSTSTRRASSSPTTATWSSPASRCRSNATSVTISAPGRGRRRPCRARRRRRMLGQIQLARFVNKVGLESIGDNLFVETRRLRPGRSTGTPGAEGFGNLQQSYLEEANVNAVTEISSLIAAQRAYEMNSKVITAADQMLSTTTPDVPRLIADDHPTSEDLHARPEARQPRPSPPRRSPGRRRGHPHAAGTLRPRRAGPAGPGRARSPAAARRRHGARRRAHARRPRRGRTRRGGAPAAVPRAGARRAPAPSRPGASSTPSPALGLGAVETGGRVQVAVLRAARRVGAAEIEAAIKRALESGYGLDGRNLALADRRRGARARWRPSTSTARPSPSISPTTARPSGSRP